MVVSVHFYSYFKDLAGCAETTAELPDKSTIRDVIHSLGARFPKWAAVERISLIAVGVEYQQRDYVLSDGDELSFFPTGAGRVTRIFMRRELTITTTPIDEAALLSGRTMTTGMGAVVYFAGVVRAMEKDAPISAIEYEAFARMAEHQFQLLFDAVEKRWPVESIRLVHRVGLIKAGEASLWVEVIAPHRAEAFAACQWLIDEMKRVVPIWKKPIV